MTSPATDAPTRAFFQEHRCFGLPEADVFFLCQGMAPALDFEGRLLLESPGRIAESPNGHGGSFPALADSGALDDMQRRGVTTISYYQVDNPLIRLLDPVFVGVHDLAAAEMSAKVVRKLDPIEKVGVLARVDGRIGIVEYTEIDDEHRYQRDAAGELAYWAGSIAIHVLEVAFARRIAAEAERYLPYHASAKKIPCVDANGRPRAPGRAERSQARALPLRRAALAARACRWSRWRATTSTRRSRTPKATTRPQTARRRARRGRAAPGSPLAVSSCPNGRMDRGRSLASSMATKTCARASGRAEDVGVSYARARTQ